MMNLLSEPKLAPELPARLLVANEAQSVAARLEYRALGDAEMEVTYPRAGERRRVERRAVAPNATASRALSDEAWRDAVRAAKAEGFAHGEREGRNQARVEMELESHAAVARERARIAGTLEDFAAAKTRYFGEIEGQVVKLALAIAARVLHRETQMDALVLGGAVRVALEKVAEGSGVVLRAADADVKAWEQTLEGAELAQTPKVLGDKTLRRGECVLETAMGTVELGVKTQLEEIEKGFFDLLRVNPATVRA